MVNPPLAEKVAGGQAGMARTDDDSGGALDGSTSQATSTVTFVGLVSASNTAERF
jgi:hypothetical protein